MTQFSRFLPSSLLTRAVLQVSRSLVRLSQWILPGRLTLFDHIVGIGSTQMLHAVARLKIADLLHQNSMTAEELADILKIHPEATHRMMRALVSFGVFKLDRTGKYQNNRLSIPLRTEVPGSMNSFADYFGSSSNVRAWSDLLATLSTGKNAFERNHQMSVWEWLSQNPEEGRIFANAMVNLTQLDAPVIAYGYPFSEVQRLCDVGGGRGTLLAELLKCHRHLSAVLFDEDYILDQAFHISNVNGEARLEKKAGNMFNEVPPGCDVYLLKDILHDWDDARCIQILKNIRAASQCGGRLLVVEVIVEKYTTEKPGPLIDLQMMTVCSEGRQRSKDEFKGLFEKSGFQLNRIFKTAHPISVIEAIAIESPQK